MADQRVERMGPALRAVFGDPAWFKRVIVAIGISLIPYLGMIWFMGYGLLYMVEVAEQRGERLPEWKAAEPQIRAGIFPFLVGMVYSIPLSILLSVVIVLGAAAGTVVYAASERFVWVAAFGIVAFMLVMAVGLAYAAVLWPVYVHVTVKGGFASGFEFGEIYRRVKRAGSAYWTAYGRTLVLGLAASFLTTLSMALVLGVAALVSWQLMSEEMFVVLASILVYPAELVAIALSSLIGIPISLASYRIWAGYARAAYWTDGVSASAAPAVEGA